MPKLNRESLAQRLADRVDFLTVAQSRCVCHAVFEIVVDALRDRDAVEIRGFGTFKVKDLNPRIRVDPVTKARTQVPQRSAVRFRSGSQLKKVVNENRHASAENQG